MATGSPGRKPRHAISRAASSNVGALAHGSVGSSSERLSRTRAALLPTVPETNAVSANTSLCPSPRGSPDTERMFPLFVETPRETYLANLLLLFMHTNISYRKTSCCTLHAAIDHLCQVCADVKKVPCRSVFAPGDAVAQCAVCGFVVLAEDCVGNAAQCIYCGETVLAKGTGSQASVQLEDHIGKVSL